MSELATTTPSHIDLKPIQDTEFKTIRHNSTESSAFGSDVSLAAESSVQQMYLVEQSAANAEALRGVTDSSPIGAAALKLFTRHNAYKGKSVEEIHAESENDVRYFSANKNNNERIVADRLALARDRFSKYTPQQAAIVKEYFQKHAGEAGSVKLFSDWKEKSGSTSWVDFLSQQSSDEQLLNVMQWHSARIEALNASPETKVRIDRLKSSMHGGVTELAKDGVVDESLPTRLAEKLNTTKVEIGDIYNLAVHNTLGYSDGANGYIVLSEDLEKEVFYHEMFHQAITDDSRHKGWDGAKLLKSILDEAVVDHLANLVAKNGLHTKDSINPVPGKANYYGRSKRLAHYFIGKYRGNVGGMTDADYVKDYTGSKELHHRLVRSVSTGTLQNLNYQAKKIKEVAGVGHSEAFDYAAGQIEAAEQESGRRYTENMKRANENFSRS